MNYGEFARRRDHVDPASLTYSSNNSTGTFVEHMRARPDPDRDLVDLDEPEGCIFEADYGVPLLLLITLLQSEELKVPQHFSPFPLPIAFQTAESHEERLFQDKICWSGSEFSFIFPFDKGRLQRDDFQSPEGSMFNSGQAHYCVWWATGQLVRGVLPLVSMFHVSSLDNSCS